jgi:hypothetical protein
MMDHYEELGVAQKASTEEIRQAYKHLIRLLHPDRSGDEPSRRLAEIQTKRLNAILAVLTHPERREEYDRTLAGGVRHAGIPCLPPPPATRAPVWFWPALGIAVLVNVILLAVPTRSKPVSQARRETPQTAVAPKPEPVRAVSRKTQLQPVRPSQSEAPLAAAGIAPQPVPTPGEDPPPAGLAASGPDPGLLELARPAPPAAPSYPTRLAGNWFYAAPSRRETGNLYPPEFIELHVEEADGVVRGRYRARYRVVDQAISPAVAFQFEGRAGPGDAVLPWNGPGGAEGEVTLRLAPGGSLEVAWVANRMGELGLISGKATLVRKLE